MIRETENDDLTGVMQKLISTYGDQQQVTSIAVDIARDLVIQQFPLFHLSSDCKLLRMFCTLDPIIIQEYRQYSF